MADVTRNAVWKLAAGSGTPALVPLTGKCGERDIPVGSPVGVAVDSGGSIYVADGSCQGRVLMLAAGSSTATVLPFTGLNQISGVAADSAGNVYVTDGALSANGRVLKLASGSNRPTTLPFAGLKMPQGVAVDSAGNLYVTDDGNKQVLETGGRLEHTDRAAAVVCLPQWPLRCGGGPCRKRLRHRRPAGAEAGGGLSDSFCPF